MRYRALGLAIVFIWFTVGGIGHFLAPDFFLKIVPPGLPFRREAVYVSGFFELVGALLLLSAKRRRAAGLGLFALTIAVTPANIYMLTHSHLFPTIPEVVLVLRLGLQVMLLIVIWSVTQSGPQRKPATQT